MIAELHRRAVEEYGKGGTPDDFLRDYVSNGGTLSTLATELSDHLRMKVSRVMLSTYASASPARKAAMTEARKEGAGAMVDKALAMLDDAGNDDNRELLNANKARADVRLKVAAFWDRSTYGQNQGAVNVQVNLGAMHLDALRARAAVRATLAAPAVVQDGPDFETVEGEQ